jgi:hypothetical protein
LKIFKPFDFEIKSLNQFKRHFYNILFFYYFGPKTFFLAQTISFVLIGIGPVAATTPAQSAPTFGFHRLPTLASIGTATPPAVLPCRVPPTAALLRA